MVQSAPKIDMLAGIECYCTDFSGIGGSIKQSSSDFEVSEMVQESLLQGISPVYDERHRYPLYILEKENIDSNHALIEIQRKLGITLKVMGIKDAKAVTRQYASLTKAARYAPRQATTDHARIELVGFTTRPIDKMHLAGNQFRIAIHDPVSTDIASFVPQINNIGNFYGLQRFGSERLVTHLVGREIVKRNFDMAVELLLSYTTEYDTPASKEIRNKSADPKNYPYLVRRLPKGMDIEYHVMSALAAGRDAISALRAIPITIRRLFVQAYQAYIFNRCLSIAIEAGENLVKAQPNDLCFEMEGPVTFGRIIKFDPASKHDMVPAVRMAGYTFQPGKGRFETITKKILDKEGVVAKDFYIKQMQELSQQGGFRQAPLWCRDFAFSRTPVVVSFRLPKGSYATTLLRELMKPRDPIRSGF